MLVRLLNDVEEQIWLDIPVRFLDVVPASPRLENAGVFLGRNHVGHVSMFT